MYTSHITITGVIMFIIAACAPAGGAFKSTAGEAYPFAAELECNGTEPFWIMSLTPGRGEFQPMDSEARTFNLSLPLSAAGRRNIWTLQGYDKTDGKSVAITLHQTGQCSDGMSDFKYDFEIVLARGDRQPLAGCCGRHQQLPARNPK